MVKYIIFMLLVFIQKSNGPKTLLCGTTKSGCWLMALLTLIANIIYVRYDFIRVILFILIPRDWSLIKRILWLMLSNAADKASRTGITSS